MSGCFLDLGQRGEITKGPRSTASFHLMLPIISVLFP